MEESNRYNFNSSDLLYKVYIYRKPLMIITGAAAVISIIISLLITNKYEAKVVLFPAPSRSISKTYLDPRDMSNKGNIYGEEEEVEQLLQVLNSEKIKQRIINKYDLIDHYDIDRNSKYIKTKITSAFNDNITFKRTEYMAVEISVLDISPDTAALIANDISHLLDSVMNDMQQERARQALAIVEHAYLEKKQQLKMLDEQMALIMGKGVVDIESRAAINEAYTNAINSGNTRAQKIFKQQLDSIAKYGGTYYSTQELMKAEQENFSLLIQKYKEAKVDAENILTNTYIIDKAYAPDKKAFPKRSIIVIASTISAFFISFILLILLELLKDFKKRELQK